MVTVIVTVQRSTAGQNANTKRAARVNACCMAWYAACKALRVCSTPGCTVHDTLDMQCVRVELISMKSPSLQFVALQELPKVGRSPQPPTQLVV